MNSIRYSSVLLISAVALYGIGACTLNKAASRSDTSVTETVDFLDGLSKANMEELGESELMIDGESTPLYLPDGERVRGNKMMDLLMTGKYIPEAYVNSDNEIKAYVLRRATDEEMNEIGKIVQDESDLVGSDASPFAAVDLSANEYSLDRLRDKIVVLNFWFIACKPCVSEIPDLNKLVEKYRDEGVVFLALALDGKDDLEKFLHKNAFDYKIIPESHEIATDYGVSSYPTHVIINKRSKIELVIAGLSLTTIKKVDRKISALVKRG